jgi:hypothetical protein
MVTSCLKELVNVKELFEEVAKDGNSKIVENLLVCYYLLSSYAFLFSTE